jgi:ATP-dependent Lon protease
MKDLALHIIPIIDTIILPNTDTKLAVDETLGLDLKNQLENASGYALAFTLKEGVEKSKVTANSFYKIGTLLKLKSIEKSSHGFLVMARGIDRVEAEEIIVNGPTTYGTYSNAEEEIDLSAEMEQQMLDFAKEGLHEISEHYKGSEDILKIIDRQKDMNSVIGHVLPYLQLSLDQKYELIRYGSQKQRGLLFIEYLGKQKEAVELQVEMAKKYSKKTNQNYRETLLREQLKAIQLELGEGDEDLNSAESYARRIEALELPEEVRTQAKRELRKLEASGNNNSEAHIIRNYLDLITDLPWKSVPKDIDMAEAKRILDRHHFGMEKVKERIIQHLAVMKIQNEKQGSILLLVGPPGTGKTSLAKSIAEALGREYIRASLGGVRDEAEIRGHRRTYIGALPGRIIQGMKKAGTKNPVFVLDEIDKLTMSNSGDPSSALLEVLDPEQNNSFSDHYLEVPYDLSDVLFIATANSLSSIPGPLLDRLETIQITSYTNNEKFHIAKDHLIRESVKEHGLRLEQIEFEDAAIRDIIDKYTREAGVRGLRKQLDTIVRGVIERIVSHNLEETYHVTSDKLQELLGHQMARHDEIRKETTPGVVTGLAWTPVGGDILFIEGTFMPGTGNLLLTGQLGDVMKESARISMSLIKSRLTEQLTLVNFSKSDLHIHVPSGATPKDGPSAGVALLTALASLATGRSVNPKLAMTGEVTLSGHVLPVGGIKEKVLAAHRAGITEIILPKENSKDVLDVPEDARAELTFFYVERIEEVLEKALNLEIKRPEELFIRDDKEKNIGFKM